MDWIRDRALTLVLMAMFLLCFAGQVATGRAEYNSEQERHGEPMVSIGEYLATGHFLEATFENWESEFLQMGMFVMLTVVLRQKGSAESRPMKQEEEDPRVEPGRVPWPVRAGGVWKMLYGHSLAIAFFALFLVSFYLHAAGSWHREAVERLARHEPAISFSAYLHSANFWFESFQNWQSEFLAVFSLVVLSIWLRQKDSPQSKPLAAPHSQTGT